MLDMVVTEAIILAGRWWTRFKGSAKVGVKFDRGKVPARRSSKVFRQFGEDGLDRAFQGHDLRRQGFSHERIVVNDLMYGACQPSTWPESHPRAAHLIEAFCQLKT